MLPSFMGITYIYSLSYRGQWRSHLVLLRGLIIEKEVDLINFA
jgi:hypothetical protein